MTFSKMSTAAEHGGHREHEDAPQGPGLCGGLRHRHRNEFRSDRLVHRPAQTVCGSVSVQHRARGRSPRAVALHAGRIRHADRLRQKQRAAGCPSRWPPSWARCGLACNCAITFACQPLGRSRGLTGSSTMDRYENAGRSFCSKSSIRAADNAGTDSGTNVYLFWVCSSGVTWCTRVSVHRIGCAEQHGCVMSALFKRFFLQHAVGDLPNARKADPEDREGKEIELDRKAKFHRIWLSGLAQASY